MDESIGSFEEFNIEKSTEFEIEVNSIDLEVPRDEIRFNLTEEEEKKYKERKNAMIVFTKKMSETAPRRTGLKGIL